MLICEDVHWKYIGLIWLRICLYDVLSVRTVTILGAASKTDSYLTQQKSFHLWRFCYIYEFRYYKAGPFPPVIFHTKSWYNFKLASANDVLSGEPYGMWNSLKVRRKWGLDDNWPLIMRLAILSESSQNEGIKSSNLSTTALMVQNVNVFFFLMPDEIW